MLSAVHVCTVNGFKIFVCFYVYTFEELHCHLLQKWKVTAFGFSQETELQLTCDMADLKCSKRWFNAFSSNVSKAVSLVQYLVLQIGGNLRNLKRILRGVSPTSFKDCLFYCRPAKKGQLKQQTLHGVLDGTVVKVMCSCSAAVVCFSCCLLGAKLLFMGENIRIMKSN